LESAPTAFVGLFLGKNVDKQVIHVALEWCSPIRCSPCVVDEIKPQVHSLTEVVIKSIVPTGSCSIQLTLVDD